MKIVFVAFILVAVLFLPGCVKSLLNKDAVTLSVPLAINASDVDAIDDEPRTGDEIKFENMVNFAEEKLPGFDILSPDDYGTVTQDKLITLSIGNWKNIAIKAPDGAVNDVEGHFRILLDPRGSEGTENLSGFIETDKSNYEISNLSAGEHEIRVELRRNDRSPFFPRVERSVHFTVAKENSIYNPQNITVQADDNGFYPSDAVHVKKGIGIRLMVYVGRENVSLGYLNFRSNAFTTLRIIAGNFGSVLFKADEDVEIESFWPNGGDGEKKKGTLHVITE